jgi:tmRNA-binding protein
MQKQLIGNKKAYFDYYVEEKYDFGWRRSTLRGVEPV